MNLQSIKRRLELADKLKLSAAEIEEHRALACDEGIYGECKWLVSELEQSVNRCADLTEALKAANETIDDLVDSPDLYAEASKKRGW